MTELDHAPESGSCGTAELMRPKEWLEQVLSARLPVAAMTELQARVQELLASDDRSFFRAFALLPRTTGKAPCELTAPERTRLASFCDGWEHPALRVDELARIWLAIAGSADPDTLFRRVEALFVMADVGELVTLYRGLPFYPDGARWSARAAEGVRSNMKAVYEAIALQNPYPARWLSDSAFNHLVLKALHVESKLELIHGLWDRRNPDLLRMLRDYASERRSAQRAIDPFVWKLVHDEAAPEITRPRTPP